MKLFFFHNWVCYNDASCENDKNMTVAARVSRCVNTIFKDVIAVVFCVTVRLLEITKQNLPQILQLCQECIKRSGKIKVSRRVG